MALSGILWDFHVVCLRTPDMTELDGYALFDAKFVIGHRGNTVPERLGVALSFRGRPRCIYFK